MKIFNKYFLMIIASCCLLTACGDDDDYKAGAPAEGQGIFFSNTASSKINLDSKATSFDVQIGRSVTGSAATVELTVEDPSGKFTIPTSVSFAADVEMATLTIGYNPEELEYDAYTKITLAVKGEENTTPYGFSTYTFEVGIPAPWKSLGKATYIDAFVGELYGLGNTTYQVEIQENEETPGLYRLVNPYGKAFPHNKEGDWDNSQNYYMEINATNPERVYITKQNTGLNWGDGNFFTYSYAAYYLDNGKTLEEANAKGLCGTFVDGVITFPSETLLCGFMESSKIYYANSTGAFKVAMPGIVLADYSINATYTGQYTSPNNNRYAIANVTLGKDVESAKVALIEGDNTEAAIAGIIDGTLEATEITEAGKVSLPCYEKGVHTFVVVSYAKGEAQESAYTRFLVSTAVSKWTPLGIAQYTDAIVGEAYKQDNETYDVEIQESVSSPGMYRLVNPYGEVFPLNAKGDWDATQDYYIEINAIDPDGVYITVQNTGLNWGDGNLYVYSEAAYALDEEGKSLADVKAEGLCGTLNNGVITFPKKSLLYGFFESSSSFYPANESEGFKIVLPNAVTTNIRNAAISKKSVNKSQVKLAKTPIQKRKVLVTPSEVTLLK